MDVEEIEMLRFSFSDEDGGSGMRTSEGQNMLDVLERKSERPD